MGFSKKWVGVARPCPKPLNHCFVRDTTLAEQDRTWQPLDDLVPKLRRVLTLLDEACSPGDLASQLGYRLHPLKGDMAGLWSTRVSGNWRVIFRVEANEAVDLLAYHRTKRSGAHGNTECMPSG